MGFLVWHQVPSLVHLLLPDNAVSLGRHAWNAQSGQIPKAAATLTSQAQATGVVLREEEGLPMSVPTMFLSS